MGTAQLDSSSRRRTSRYLHGDIVRHHALINVHMVAVQIVRDIRVLTSPGLECFQLALGLTHVAVEVVKVAELGSLSTGITVGGIEALVVLNVHNDIVLARLSEQVEVVGEELGRRLGDENVDLALNGVQSDGVMGGVGSENGDCRAGGEGVNGGFVGFWVRGVVGGEGGEGDIKAVVDFGDILLQVFAWVSLSQFGQLLDTKGNKGETYGFREIWIQIRPPYSDRRLCRDDASRRASGPRHPLSCRRSRLYRRRSRSCTRLFLPVLLVSRDTREIGGITYHQHSWGSHCDCCGVNLSKEKILEGKDMARKEETILSPSGLAVI